jgi:GTP cyclohydrolase I
MSTSPDKIQRGVKLILEGIGEDTNREGLVDTPKRVAKSMLELCAGYSMSPAKVLKRRFSAERYDEMILIKNIDFYSMCEHHMLPFNGIAHIAYIPKEKVIGLSKFARILDVYTRRLQIQEKLTTQIAKAIMDYADPVGVAVIIQATHQCMTARGVKKHAPSMVTSTLLGAFKTNPTTRQEFLSLAMAK